MIAFVLASYVPNTPAGIERATAALAVGLRKHGHEAVVFTAVGNDAPGIVRLRSLEVTFPADDRTLRAAVDASSAHEEIAELLERHHAEAVVYTDALWGLGRAMADHPARKVLAAHVLGHDDDLRPALERADVVITPSAVVQRQALERGYAADDWRIVPNALLYDEAAWLDDQRRARLREHGPIRVLARPSPEKGVDALLAATPPSLDRPVEVMLAAAAFEQHTGQQDEITRRIRAAARPGRLRVQTGGLTWMQVAPWLASAAVVIVPSLAETFGLVALEAMNVGTPVVAYDVGNLPELIGAGGVTVARAAGPAELWRAAVALTEDPVTYREKSRAAYYRSRDFRPTDIADAFLKAVW